jgi:hypothetical protein
MKYIYHHLGLGDHIICNGLVRSIINDNDEYTLFVKNHNKETVKFMYRDLKNINFICGDDSFVKSYILDKQINNNDLITIGFGRIYGTKNFEESFYLQHNVPFTNKWSKFYVKRDLESEKKIFDYFNVSEGNYVFIHDDITRNYLVDENLIQNKDLKIIRPISGLTSNVFDYCYLMEKSKESHFIDSSFRLIFDCMKLRDTNIYYHLKMKNGIKRNFDPYDNAMSCKLNFKIIE